MKVAFNSLPPPDCGTEAGLSDRELLRHYAATRSEAAFAQIVKRHAPFVYSAALRQIKDHSLAQDITQAVFVILARKAATLQCETVLAGWLFRAVRFAVRDTLKIEGRRRRREQEAAAMESINADESESTWEQLSPLLDEAVAKLGVTDRQALLLRFFEKKGWREVGAALGMKENTARVRVNRALERLRSSISRRGMAVSATALGGLLVENSVQTAPAGVIVTLNAVVTSSSPSAVAAVLVKDMLRHWLWLRGAKVFLLVLIAVSAVTALVALQKSRAERVSIAGTVRATVVAIDRAFSLDQPDEFVARIQFRGAEDERFRGVLTNFVHASADWAWAVRTLSGREDSRYRALIVAFNEILAHQPPQGPVVVTRDRATDNAFPDHSLQLVHTDGVWKWDLFATLTPEMRVERLLVLRQKTKVMLSLTAGMRKGEDTNEEKVFTSFQNGTP